MNNPYHFADFITTSSSTKNSVLCAGIDPTLEAIPEHFLIEASKEKSDEDFLYKALLNFYTFSIDRIHPYISCIKPNIAFFEQFGIGGLKALQEILLFAKDLHLSSILDAKRGDIGSTAESYVKSYLTGITIKGKKFTAFDADSITVNPFLGFDTLEVFSKACIDSGKGIFILVKTSNSGSKDLQDLLCSDKTISQRIADWILEANQKTIGSCGLGLLGAVVGATHPEHLKNLRKNMPKSIFLIPGYGAQGGKPEDLSVGFNAPFTGAVVNASRALFSSLHGTKEEMSNTLIERSKSLSKALNI